MEVAVGTGRWAIGLLERVAATLLLGVSGNGREAGRGGWWGLIFCWCWSWSWSLEFDFFGLAVGALIVVRRAAVGC